MKRLITNINGGMPDLLDNFRWMETGMVEAIEGICKGLARGRHSFRLWGANVSRDGTSVYVPPGMIYHNGEIFNVESDHITAHVANVLYWERADHYHSSGLLTFQNGQQHNVYLDRRMILRHAPTPPAGALLDSQLLSLNQLLDDHSIVSGNLVLPAGFTPANAIDIPRWHRKSDGTVFMTGVVSGNTPSSSFFAIDIPPQVFLSPNHGNVAAFPLCITYISPLQHTFTRAWVDKAERKIFIDAIPQCTVSFSLAPIILH